VVADNLERPRALQAKVTCPDGANARHLRAFPLPVAPGAPSPLKYVFFIVRENKNL